MSSESATARSGAEELDAASQGSSPLASTAAPSHAPAPSNVLGKAPDSDALNQTLKRCTEVSCRDTVPRKSRGGALHPPGRTEIGRASWFFLHTLAAEFPESTEASRRFRIARWIWAFANLYPCHLCRDSFVPVVRTNPPTLNSSADFSVWICRMHNYVNEDLSAPLFNCNPSRLLRVYGKFGKAPWPLSG